MPEFLKVSTIVRTQAVLIFTHRWHDLDRSFNTLDMAWDVNREFPILIA